MDARTPPAALRAEDDSTRALVGRLWREYIARYRGSIALILVLTLILAGAQALYPVVIQRAIGMFEAREQRILYQVPILVVCLMTVKALAQYFQTVLVQKLVLRVIRTLQER